MTTLFACDRCGEEHSVAHLYKVTMTTANEAPLMRELCPECASRLYHWFKKECHNYLCDEVDE